MLIEELRCARLKPTFSSQFSTATWIFLGYIQTLTYPNLCGEEPLNPLFTIKLLIIKRFTVPG